MATRRLSPKKKKDSDAKTSSSFQRSFHSPPVLAAMDSNAASLQQADLDKLNDKDKAELRTFINNEQQRTRIQSRKCLLV